MERNVSCLYLLKTFLYQFKPVNKTFLLKTCWTVKAVIFVFIYQGHKKEYIGQLEDLVKANKYLKT